MTSAVNYAGDIWNCDITIRLLLDISHDINTESYNFSQTKLLAKQ